MAFGCRLLSESKCNLTEICHWVIFCGDILTSGRGREFRRQRCHSQGEVKFGPNFQKIVSVLFVLLHPLPVSLERDAICEQHPSHTHFVYHKGKVVERSFLSFLWENISLTEVIHMAGDNNCRRVKMLSTLENEILEGSLGLHATLTPTPRHAVYSD